MTESSRDAVAPTFSSDLNQSLSKYLRVWIWSIIFGLDTTLTLTLQAGGSFGKYLPFIAFILVIPNILSAIMVIVSWIYLLRFMLRAIIPLIKLDQASYDELVSRNTLTQVHVFYLRTAMQAAILAIVLKAFGILFESLFAGLGRY